MTPSSNQNKIGRGKIYDNITDTIGNTPLVRIHRLAKKYNSNADVLLKLEFFNPISSVKDRIGLSMIEDLENQKLIHSNSVIIEPTSGNTGIALAFVCASKGYRLILTMPESMSIERRKMLKLLGAEIILTPKEEGMKGAIAKADEIHSQTSNSIIPNQFTNPSNPEIHKKTTALEIWNDTEGQVDYLVAGVGTGGTITGCGEVLKHKKPQIKTIAVEPEASPVLSGGNPGPHPLQGIGAGFIPEILNRSLINEIIQVSNENAIQMAKEIAFTEGIPVGLSSGAALYATFQVATRPELKGKTIVTIIPSFAERYLSTVLFSD